MPLLYKQMLLLQSLRDFPGPNLPD